MGNIRKFSAWLFSTETILCRDESFRGNFQGAFYTGEGKGDFLALFEKLLKIKLKTKFLKLEKRSNIKLKTNRNYSLFKGDCLFFGPLS